jgi:hypothetical protein
MVDDAATRKEVNRWVGKPYAVLTAHIEKRRKLFEAINAFVMQEGGWIISPPGDRRVRIETPQNSSLIIRLAEAGHRVRYVTTGTRVVSSGMMTTDIFELTLSR